MLLRVFYYMVGGNATTSGVYSIGSSLRNTSNQIQSGALSFSSSMSPTGLLNPKVYAKVNEGYYSYGTTSSQVYYDNLSLVLGKGDTPPTLDDYTLADPVTEDLTVSKRNGESFGDTKSVWTVTNNETSSITLKEFGFMNRTPYSGSSSSQYNILYVRGLFDTPVTIAPGETKVIMISLC